MYVRNGMFGDVLQDTAPAATVPSTTTSNSSPKPFMFQPRPKKLKQQVPPVEPPADSAGTSSGIQQTVMEKLSAVHPAWLVLGGISAVYLVSQLFSSSGAAKSEVIESSVRPVASVAGPKKSIKLPSRKRVVEQQEIEEVVSEPTLADYYESSAV